jgi:hypothetical protein
LREQTKKGETMGEFLTTHEVEAKTGATFRQLNYWARRGWIPDMPTDPGSGSVRQWGPAAIAEAEKLAAVSKRFMTPHQINLPALADFVRRAAEAGVKP